MPLAPLPFLPSQESGADVLAGAGALSLNVVADGRGAVTRRPAVVAADNGPTTALADAPVVGMHVTDSGTVLVATGHVPGAVQVWRLVPGAAHDLESTPLAHVTASGRLVFAETEAIVIFATGRSVHKVVQTGWAMSRLQSAPLASYVVAHGVRLLANDKSGDRTKVHYSAPALGANNWAGHEQWGVVVSSIGRSGYFTAEGRPDPVVALAENSNEVFVFGATTLQTFSPDPSLVYASVATREFGCSAPYSVVKDDQSFAWIDHRRRVVHSDGRTLNILSDQVQADLDDVADPEDAVGMRVRHGPVDVLAWRFGRDKRTLAWSKGGGWGQWSGSADRGLWAPWPVTAAALDPTAGETWVGLEDGRVGVLRHGAATDLGDEFPALVRTGFLDRGTDMRKHCAAVRLSLRRKRGTGAAKGHVRWRDQEGDWSQPVVFTLDDADIEPVVVLRSLGVYRRRQWEFAFLGDDDFSLARAAEEYTVLGS